MGCHYISCVERGLGIIDPFDQSQGLLTKLIVRGLLPGPNKWNWHLTYTERFFEYTVKVDSKILLAKKRISPSSNFYWYHIS